MDSLKKATKLNVQLKATCFDEAISDKSSSNDGNLHI